MVKGMWSMACECGPEAVPWIRDLFMDCVVTPLDMIGFLFGLSSIGFWIVAQLPQFIENIQYESADALSPWFLFQWLTGDTLNLLGCILTGDQLATETFTACYFIFADCCIIAQYLFYQSRNKAILAAQGDQGGQIILKHAMEKDPSMVTGRSGAAIIAHARAKVPVSQIGTIDRLKTARDFAQKSGKGLKLPGSGHSPPRKGSGPLSGRVTRIIDKYGLEYGPLMHKRVNIKHHWQMQQQNGGRSAGAVQGSSGATVVDHLMPLGAAVSQARMIPGSSQGERVRPPRSSSRVQGKILACVTGLFLCGGWLSNLGVRELIFPAERQSSEHQHLDFLHSKSWNRKLLEVEFSPHVKGIPLNSQNEAAKVPCGGGQQAGDIRSLGLLLGWGSVAFYLGSRISQLVLNFQRKSAEGLSMAMFICAFLANFTYGAAIIVRSNSISELSGKAPWLIGSIGTLSLDVSIYLQAQYLDSLKRAAISPVNPLEKPLLRNFV